ncbi:TetR/AcrR family transcriptional regulator [Thioalkalivibrio thiocyanodenitrificans]|uniref:TetR/AcrR family transcriptional regulator n=1 Tax=Thioalkalivibrio thiocyanodenitrificans TaxID=243063 RepID=UPI00037BD758|nr:TetR/AcrR family transcriptional regulator [Thioalkalivibrio thiocyanodenitrificans]
MATSPDTRRRLLDNARSLIHLRGYGAVGVAEICARSGVRKGSFYHFFPSKQALTLAMLEDHFEIFEDQLLVPAFDRRTPPMERFEAFVRHLHDHQAGTAAGTGHLPGCPFGNLGLELAAHDEPIRIKVESLLQRIRGYFQAALEDALAEGILTGTDPRATAEAMLAYLEGVLLLARTRNDARLILELGPAVSDIRIPSPAD